MEKVLFSALAALLLCGNAMAQEGQPSTVINPQFSTGTAMDVPAITWESTEKDFGKVPQSIPVTVTYSFTNTGKAPLIVSHVQPGCGCTGAKWTETPIAPGDKGTVTVTFNAANPGPFEKSLTVTANTEPGTIILRFKGEVIPAAVPATPATPATPNTPVEPAK